MKKARSRRATTTLSEPQSFPVSILKKCTEEMYAKKLKFDLLTLSKMSFVACFFAMLLIFFDSIWWDQYEVREKF